VKSCWRETYWILTRLVRLHTYAHLLEATRIVLPVVFVALTVQVFRRLGAIPGIYAALAVATAILFAPASVGREFLAVTSRRHTTAHHVGVTFAKDKIIVFVGTPAITLKDDRDGPRLAFGKDGVIAGTDPRLSAWTEAIVAGLARKLGGEVWDMETAQWKAVTP